MNTPFWSAHAGADGKLSIETLVLWKKSLSQLLLKAKFLAVARHDDPLALHHISALSFARILTARTEVPRHVRVNMESMPLVIGSRVSYEVPRVGMVLLMLTYLRIICNLSNSKTRSAR